MKKYIEQVRYGSVHFLYLISLSFVFNVFYPIARNALSFAAFAVISLLLLFLIDFSGFINKRAVQIIASLIVALSCILDLSQTVIIFSYNSDRANTLIGIFVFCVIILASSALISRGGFYNLQRMSNILYTVPLFAYILNIASLSNFSIDELKSIKLFTPVNSAIFPVIFALIFFLDSYILCFMQKKENCYKKSAARTGYLISLFFILAFSFIFKGVFGDEILEKLISPVITAAGLIGISEIKQLYMFIFSVILLFRLSVKICFIKSNSHIKI